MDMYVVSLQCNMYTSVFAVLWKYICLCYLCTYIARPSVECGSWGKVIYCTHFKMHCLVTLLHANSHKLKVGGLGVYIGCTHTCQRRALLNTEHMYSTGCTVYLTRLCVCLLSQIFLAAVCTNGEREIQNLVCYLSECCRLLIQYCTHVPSCAVAELNKTAVSITITANLFILGYHLVDDDGRVNRRRYVHTWKLTTERLTHGYYLQLMHKLNNATVCTWCRDPYVLHM